MKENGFYQKQIQTFDDEGGAISPASNQNERIDQMNNLRRNEINPDVGRLSEEAARREAVWVQQRAMASKKNLLIRLLLKFHSDPSLVYESISLIADHFREANPEMFELYLDYINLEAEIVNAIGKDGLQAIADGALNRLREEEITPEVLQKCIDLFDVKEKLLALDPKEKKKAFAGMFRGVKGDIRKRWHKR